MLVLLAAGLLGYSFFMLGSELEQLDHLTSVAAAQLPEPRVGQPVLVASTIAENNAPLIHDLVLACEETQDTDGRAWMPRQQFNQPLVVTRDGVDLTVTLRQPCPRGRYHVIPNPESKLWRWTGYRRGDALTVVGTVTGTRPLTLQGENAFGGSIEDYRRYLTRVRWYVVPGALVGLLAGSGLIIAGMRRRRA